MNIHATRQANGVRDAHSIVPFFIQLSSIVSITVLISFSTSRSPFCLFIHYCIDTAIFALLFEKTLHSWTKLKPANKRQGIAGLVLMVVYLAAMRGYFAPETFYFVFLSGAYSCASTLVEDHRNNNVYRAILFASCMLSFAKLTDRIFLWTADAGIYLNAWLTGLRDLTGYPFLSLSFTYLGGWHWIFTLALVFGFLLSAKGRARLYQAPALFLLAITFLLQAAEPGFFRQWILSMAAVIWMMFFAYGRVFKSRYIYNSIIGSMLVSFGIAVLFHISPVTETGVSRCLLLKGAYETRIPEIENPQKIQGASLGFFHEYLKRTTLSYSIVNKVDQKSLSNTQVLVICNLDRRLSETEIQAILDYVRKGGGLLVFGDHTDISGVMQNTNPLISHFGIRLRFDSAIPEIGPGWADSLEARWHPATCGLPSPDLIKISVGASLDHDGGAKPLIVARTGYSDQGDRQAPERAFLGNWSHDEQEERIGDLTLAAEAQYGNGRVIVYGDTALLQESSFSQSWSHVSDLLGWIGCGGNNDRSSSVWNFLGALSCLLGFICLSMSNRTFSDLAFVSVLPLLTFVIVQLLGSSTGAPSLPEPPRTAWIDLKSGSNITLQGQEASRISAFNNALMACGYLPLNRLEEKRGNPKNTDLAVLPSLRRKVGGKQAEELVGFVQQGGKAILLIGCHDRNRYGQILEALNVRILDIPLGFCPDTKTANGMAVPSFSRGWGLKHDGSLKHESAHALVTSLSYPIVLKIPEHQGVWFLVGDPTFPWNKNFKTGETFNKTNFLFLQQLLSDPKKDDE